MHVCAHSAQGCQKRMPDTLKLELQAIGSRCHMGVLGAKLRSFRRAASNTSDH